MVLCQCGRIKVSDANKQILGKQDEGTIESGVSQSLEALGFSAIIRGSHFVRCAEFFGR